MKLSNVTKAYGERRVFSALSLDIEQGKITCVMGPSGCGKSTLLRIIGGLTEHGGTVEYDGENKRVSVVFQNARLFPNLTVARNLDLVLKITEKDKEKRGRCVNEFLSKVGLTDAANLYPSALSGGMKQRVSLARAFIYPAPLLLMDEPFKELDISLKKQMTEFFKSLYESDKRTTVLVTHDIDEAVTLGHKIVVLNAQGEIVLNEAPTEGTRQRIYERI